MTEFRKLNHKKAIVDEVNRLLDWRAGAHLPDGQLLGRVFARKRPAPQPIPDRRIKMLDDLVGLKGKSVLEMGCFEGFHTLGLLTYTPDVTAIDVRPINVVKTLTRLSMHGAHAKVFIQDCAEVDKSFGTFDVVFHFGVLYHMMNPVEHLLNLGQVAPVLYLDTHIAGPKLVTGEYSVNGEAFDFDWRGEGGWREPFSGVAPKSRQLTLDGLNKALEMAGYTDRQLLQERAERNGPRILMLARKPGA